MAFLFEWFAVHEKTEEFQRWSGFSWERATDFSQLPTVDGILGQRYSPLFAFFHFFVVCCSLRSDLNGRHWLFSLLTSFFGSVGGGTIALLLLGSKPAWLTADWIFPLFVFTWFDCWISFIIFQGTLSIVAQAMLYSRYSASLL
jgi:hypothetical protein